MELVVLSAIRITHPTLDQGPLGGRWEDVSNCQLTARRVLILCTVVCTWYIWRTWGTQFRIGLFISWRGGSPRKILRIHKYSIIIIIITTTIIITSTVVLLYLTGCVADLLVNIVHVLNKVTRRNIKVISYIRTISLLYSINKRLKQNRLSKISGNARGTNHWQTIEKLFL